MHVDPRIVRSHFQREVRRIQVLDRTRVPTNVITAPGLPGEPPKGVAAASTVPAAGQLAFYFFEPICAPRLRGQAHHELAIATRIVAEKQYAPALLNWANRRLSIERYRLKQRARAAALRRKREQRLESCEQRCAAVTRQLGALVRRLDGQGLLDTKGIQSLSGELRSLATLCADGAVSL